MHGRSFPSARVIIVVLPLPSVLDVFPSVEPTTIVNVCVQFAGFEQTDISKKYIALKSTNVTHMHTQTDQLHNGTLYTPRYKETFSPKGKNGLISSREVNEARRGFILAVGRVRSKGKNKQKQNKNKKNHPTQSTPLNPHQPGDRDHLETAREKTRSAR